MIEFINDTFYIAAAVLLLAKATSAIPRFVVLIAVVYTLKLLSASERPNGSDLMSFPSGHSAIAWYLTGVYQFNPLVAIWAASASYARVYMREHWPHDVIIGGLLGLSFAYI